MSDYVIFKRRYANADFGPAHEKWKTTALQFQV